ncbi:MAG: flagellar basal body P-ring protein FlgI [Deferrisomatales bacterium]
MPTALRVALLLALLVPPGLARAARVKDIAHVDGVRDNQLIGYGLVVGLNGTGDDTGTEFTARTAANLLERFGISVSADEIDFQNLAAVMVTADLPPFARAGQRIDVTISSLGDAKSLQGGVLLLTPLRAPNGQVYAVAQGAVTLGGYGAGAKGASVQVNHPTVGRIPGGATLERDAPMLELTDGHLDLVLHRADFTTAARTARAVDAAFGPGTAQALDAGRVRVRLPEEEGTDPVAFLSALENVTVQPDVVAKVVVDEKTGTVVLGEEVRVRPVAISHGALTVQITPYLEVSQPEPTFGVGPRGRTVARDRAEVAVAEEEGHVFLLDQGESLASLVRALNALAVSPRDLVAIFRTLKAAGALDAELEIL